MRRSAPWQAGVMLAAALQVAPVAAAQRTVAPPAAAVAEPGSELRIFLLTMGQGDEVWEEFGHNAIWIRDESRGTSIAYNWGVFDFAQPHFLQRFLTGNTRYWVAAEDAQAMADLYVARNRTVWVQELDLTPAQRVRLRDFIDWNVRPENRYYRYDYYRDNCSTRARDALDLALGGQLRRATTARASGTSYHWHSARLTGRDVPVYTGITLGLGHPADRPISLWEEMFIPMEMQRHLREVRVADASGALHPLVKSERVVFEANRPPELTRPPRYLPYFILAGLMLGAGVLLLGRAAEKRRAARRAWAAVVASWSVLCGVIGVLMILAWTLTTHVYTRSNENFLQCEPLSLALATALLFPRRPGAVRASRWLAWTIAAVAAVALVVKVLPTFRQDNLPIVALTLPMHLAVAWTASALTRGTLSGRRVAEPAARRNARAGAAA